MASALELFAAKGYAATTVEEVCRHANVSTRNFYEEFDNRLALLSALTDEIAERALRALLAVEVEPGPDFVARRTRGRVSALVHAFVDDPRVARVMFIESVIGQAQDPDLLTGTLVRFPRWLSAYWRDHLDSVGVPPARQRSLILGLVGAVAAVLVDWVTRPAPRPPVEGVIDDIVELTNAILRLPHPTV
jgi:AcrR family transcriptional regulator